MANVKVGRGGRKTRQRGVRKAAAAKAKPEKRVRGSGVERLKKAVDKRLGQASEKLADVLLKKALAGKAENTRLMVNLAESKKPRKSPEKKLNGPTVAELLEAEPEWVEPEVGDVWNGDGWTRQRTGEQVERGGTVAVEEEEVLVE